jgi:hypothetical protein
LRVKVRFIKKATNPQTGKSYRKIKWYGGVICGTANGSRIIKIHYDDGTSEVANFPDKDIIVSDVNNGRHGGVGGGGGAFVPDESSPISGPMALNDDDDDDDDDQAMMSSAEEEEEEEEAKRSGNTPEKKRQKRDSDDEENEFVFSPSTEKHDGRVDEEKEGSTAVLLSEVAASINQSSINRGVGRDTGIETNMELMATSHGEYLGRAKMTVNDEMGDEGEDGEIVESCPLTSSSREEIVCRPSNEDVSPTSVPSKCHAALSIEEGTLPKEDGEEERHMTENIGEYVNDSDNIPLLISNDKPQDEGPSEASPGDRSGAVNCTNHQRLVMKQEGGGDAINSAEVEVHASGGIDVEGSELKVADETMRDAGFVRGVERTPPEDVPTKQATAADLCQQDHTEKKKKKRGPLSIHIGLPGAKRKKLMDEGSKLAKPQDETPVATTNDDDTAMDEVGMKKVLVGDNVEGKLTPTISVCLEVKSQSSGAQTDPTSLNTVPVKDHDYQGDSLSDGEIQEDVLVRHHWISLREAASYDNSY